MLHQKTQQKTKKFSKKKHGLKGVRNTIEKKNRLFKKCIKCVDSDKNILHQEYKTYRNSLSTLLKQSNKCNYYFRNNISNIKNT